jgi:hypothetical protein
VEKEKEGGKKSRRNKGNTHLRVLCIASSTRGPVVVELTTSSRAIIISIKIKILKKIIKIKNGKKNKKKRSK